MKPSLASLYTYQATFEGVVPHMYLDIRGLVTVGIGNLIDPVSIAIGLRFCKADGSIASPAEISDEWHCVKSSDTAAKGAAACAAFTTLHLTQEDIAALVDNTGRSFEILLRGVFLEWDEWPEQAQLATLGVAWAVGVAKISTGFPLFVAACRRQDWATAAKECLINATGNPGVVPRNKANRQLFLECV